MDYSNYTVLLVDDEQAILNSLQRLLRPLKCKVLTCVSPVEALALLDQQPVAMIISDMRMPEMSGETFLETAAKMYPDTERVVISGYADAQATIEAINRGKISRFLLKPWEDGDVLEVVSKGFEIAFLKQENQRLQKQTLEKNIELQDLNKVLEELNQSLDTKVQVRTEQLKKSNESIKTNYRSVIKMFSTLTARRLGLKASKESQKLNSILLAVANRCGIEGQDLKQLYYAWQLREIGKLSFNDALLKSSFLQLEPEKQRAFQVHPLLAQAACLMVKPLYPAGQIILQHKEYLDGSGYPKGLKGDEIKGRAKILCVVNDYVELTTGLYDERPFSTTEAINYMQNKAPERYDQNLVRYLAEVVESLAKEGETLKDIHLNSDQLRTGMQLSRDLISDEGVLLLSAESILDETSIERIREIEFNLKETFEVYISQ